MSLIEKKGRVNADPAVVFAFLAERSNAPKVVPHLEKVWDIVPTAAGIGQTWRWAFRLFGLPFEGTAEMTEFDPGRRLRFTTKGKLQSTWTYSVAPAPGGSELTVAVEHSIPDSLLGKAADRIALSRLGESSTQHILENVAARFQSGASS